MQLMKTEEVSERLQVHPGTVRNLVKRGELPYVKIGKSLRFKTDDVEALVERLAQASGQSEEA